MYCSLKCGKIVSEERGGGAFEGSSFCTFGGVLYKTKTLVKFIDSRKYSRSPFLLVMRIMFHLFSDDFEGVFDFRSSVFVWYHTTRSMAIICISNLLFLNSGHTYNFISK